MSGRSGPVTVTEALDVLAVVGGEETHLDGEVATRIAHDAARIAADIPGRSNRPPDEVPIAHESETRPLTPTAGTESAAPGRGRRRLAVAAAAAVLVLAAGYGIVAATAQPTETDTGRIETELVPSTTGTIETPEVMNPTSTAATVTDDSSVDDRRAGITAPSTTIADGPVVSDDTDAAVTNTDGNDGTTRATATTVGQGGASASPAAQTTAVPPASRSLSSDGVAISAGRAGAVALSIDEGSATVLDVVPEPGWAHTIGADGRGGVDVAFSDGNDSAAVRVEYPDRPTAGGDGGDDGDDDDEEYEEEDDDAEDDERGRSTVIRLVVDPDSDYRPTSATSRRFDLGSAGRVDVAYDANGLTGLEVVAEPGWSPEITTLGSQRLTIRFVGSGGIGSTRHDLGVGQLTLTIETGS